MGESDSAVCVGEGAYVCVCGGARDSTKEQIIDHEAMPYLGKLSIVCI